MSQRKLLSTAQVDKHRILRRILFIQIANSVASRLPGPSDVPSVCTMCGVFRDSQIPVSDYATCYT
jgi:hypothetical protein